MTWLSMPCAASQRASQKPSCPASNATAMRVIRWQLDFFGRPFAVVVSDHGVQPQAEAHRRIQRYDRRLSDAVGGFRFSGPHTLVATTWKQPGALDDTVPISV